MDFQITPIQNAGLDLPVKRSFLEIHKWKIVIGVLFILIGWAVLYYFFGNTSFSESRVTFSIEGSSEITSGELVSYKISYFNGNKVGLAGATLDFIYPVDSIPVKNGNISNSLNESVEIGSIPSGEKGERVFTAYIVGDRGNIKTAKATIAFKSKNISSTFEKHASTSSTITSLAIPLTLVAPPSATRGQNISYLIDYRNQSQQDYSDLRLKLKYPDGFKYSSASPQPSLNFDTWNLPQLKQGDGSRITVQGVLNGNERETKFISLVLQKKIVTPLGDVFIDFEKTEASTVISSPYLTVKIKLNDSTNYTAHLNDDLKYTIDFGNSSTVDISGLTLSAKLEGSMFDFSSVRSNAFFDSRTNTLTWDQSLTPELALLRPGQSGKAEFNIKLKNSFSGSGSSIASSIVKTSTHFETQNIPVDLGTELLSVDDQLITRISSDPVFSQRAIINDQQFGAIGPFPPRVDSKTVFTVHWALVNPSSDVSPAKVTAILAPGVKWENMVRTGNGQSLPIYNPKTNMITWDMGTLPTGTGVASQKYETFFQISITPSLNQVGQAVPLLKSIRFDGADAYTKEKITRTAADILTSSVADSDASGLVQPK